MRASYCKAMLAGLLLAAVSCGSDLPVASEILHMRVLGATTTVIGDEARTTPKPGERARMRWTVAFPDVGERDYDSELASIFFVCTAPETFSGTPICQEFLDLAEAGSVSGLLAVTRGQELPNCERNPDRVYEYGPFRIVCSTGTPDFEVAVARNAKERARLVQGLICRNGTPRLDNSDPTGTSCKPASGASEDEIERVAVYGTVPIQYEDNDSNDNPSIEAATFLLHDPPLPWPELAEDIAATLDADTCLDQSEAGRVASTGGHEELITLRYDAAEREQYDGEPEVLEFSAYTTFGELSRRFTVFEPDDEVPLENTFTWQISREERAELLGMSKRVRFFFTLMDRRGGFSIATRDLCINR